MMYVSCHTSCSLRLDGWIKERPYSLSLHTSTLYIYTDYEGHSLCLLTKFAQGQLKSDFITSALMKQKKALLELYWSCVRIKRPIPEGKVRKTVLTPSHRWPRTATMVSSSSYCSVQHLFWGAGQIFVQEDNSHSCPAQRWEISLFFHILVSLQAALHHPSGRWSPGTVAHPGLYASASQTSAKPIILNFINLR